MNEQDKPKKRSVVIRGHNTSISIEDVFWDELKTIATAQGISVSTLVGRIEYEASAANVSAAVRAYVVKSFRVPDGRA